MNALFLMSPPRRDWAPRGKANFKSESSGVVPAGAALREWIALADAITAAGGEILVLPAAPHLPLTGLPFTAESGHFAPDGTFLLPNPTPEHRQPEAGYIAGFAAALGWRTYSPRAKWEGQGDVVALGDGRTLHTWGDGQRARSQRAAFDELRPYFGTRTLSVGFRADPWFHGNTFMAVYHAADEQPHLLLCEEALLPGERARLAEFLDGVPVFAIPRADSLAYATNALQVENRILAPRGLSPAVLAFWRGLGLEVVELGFDVLFHQGGGAAVCLTNRLDGVNRDALPAHLRFSAQRARLHAAL